AAQRRRAPPGLRDHAPRPDRVPRGPPSPRREGRGRGRDDDARDRPRRRRTDRRTRTDAGRGSGERRERAARAGTAGRGPLGQGAPRFRRHPAERRGRGRSSCLAALSFGGPQAREAGAFAPAPTLSPGSVDQNEYFSWKSAIRPIVGTPGKLRWASSTTFCTLSWSVAFVSIGGR